MAKWVELKDLLEHPEKYGVDNPMELQIAYVPDRKGVTLPSSMTGYEKEQTFQTETEEHKYYPVLSKGQPYLVSNKTTKQELYLKGKQGDENGPEALKTQAKIYGNDELGAKGVTWNEVTIEILEILPSFLKEIRDLWWVDIQWREYGNFGLQCVCSRDLHIESLCFGSSTYNYAVLPLVSLPFNILVDISAIGKEPLKLTQPKQVEGVANCEEEQRTVTKDELVVELETIIGNMKDILGKAETLLNKAKNLT